MSEAVTLTFIFQTIGVILALTGLAIVMIKYKTKKMKEI
jgi:hypothetical protein